MGLTGLRKLSLLALGGAARLAGNLGGHLSETA